MTNPKSILESDFSATALINAAVKFINTTSGHIFLTGKAGTGKTTFLKKIPEKTHKQFLVVAPTGIAALNAGGVTIHSQFLLPHGTFLPERKMPLNLHGSGNYIDQDTLARKHPLNSARKQVLRSIDLLVIDEVSMLRADLLDAIDYRLKAARGNFNRSFGGVQLLLIGDLFQLPPVVKRDEQVVLENYYSSPWFYDSKALRNSDFVYIELDKIFRQADEDFISILNNLRNNCPTVSDIKQLNSYYRTAEEISALEEVITLTTHNYKANELNQRMLRSLNTPSCFFEAQVNGDFPESMFPVAQRLELKEGAQIMFIKNDSEEKAYFNGKLATVISISKNEITVKMAGQENEYTLKKELWKNRKYTVSTETQELEEDVIGAFEQFPIKLAWAITVHKSQGLTFEKAIIDVGQAFADGQVYVALSRLRSLDGLILRSPINPAVVSTNTNIVAFTEKNNQPDTLDAALEIQQQHYVHDLLIKTFDFTGIVKEIRYIQKGQPEITGFSEDSMKPILTQLAESFELERINTEKFKYQLTTLVKDKDFTRLIDRIAKGRDYYKHFLQEMLKILLRHTAEMQQRKRVKTYVNNLKDLDQFISKKLEEVDKVETIVKSILLGTDSADFNSLSELRAKDRARMLEEIQPYVNSVSSSGKKKPKKEKTKNADKRSTYEITFELFKSGLGVPQIAKERGLVESTIEGHLAKAVEEGKIEAVDFIPKESVRNIEQALMEMPDEFTSKDLYTRLAGKYEYGLLRAVMAKSEKKAVRPKK